MDHWNVFTQPVCNNLMKFLNKTGTSQDSAEINKGLKENIFMKTDWKALYNVHRKTTSLKFN